MKVPELKALAKERGLRSYSKLRKAELIALLTPGQLLAPDLQNPLGLCHLHLHHLPNQIAPDK